MGIVGSKTISLAEDAYEALSQMRQPGESFSEVVRRLTRTRSLADLTETMDEDAAESLAEAIEANRRDRTRRRREELGLE